MKKFQKLFHEVSKTAIVLIALIVPFATMTCREDLFEVAKNANDARNDNKPPYSIAALVDDGGNTKVVLSDGVKTELVYVHDGAPYGTVYLDRRGWVFVMKSAYEVHAVKDSINVYYDFDGEGFPYGFGEENDYTVMLGSESLFKFEPTKNPPWTYIRKVGVSYPIALFRASDDSGSYVVNEVSGNFEFSHISTPANIAGKINTPPNGTFFFDAYKGCFYAGSNSQIKNIYDKFINASPSFHSFAVLDETDIYAGGIYSTHLEIMKVDFNQTTVQQFYNFGSMDGSMQIAAYDSSTLVVGVKDSTSKNGLYLFKTTDSTLTQLSSLPVHAVSTLKKK